MAKLKIQDHHLALFKVLGKDFDMDKEEVGETIIEQGFVFMALISHGNEKALLFLDEVKKDKDMMKFVDKLREYWEAGKNKPEG